MIWENMNILMGRGKVVDIIEAASSMCLREGVDNFNQKDRDIITEEGRIITTTITATKAIKIIMIKTITRGNNRHFILNSSNNNLTFSRKWDICKINNSLLWVR